MNSIFTMSGSIKRRVNSESVLISTAMQLVLKCYLPRYKPPPIPPLPLTNCCDPRAQKGKLTVFCNISFPSEKSEMRVEFGDTWVKRLTQ